MKERTKEKAFTLAEVLITLGIIGVVAALTIPVIISKVDENIGRSEVKKAYNVLSGAIQRMVSDNNGTIWDNTSGSATTNTNNMRDALASYLAYSNIDTFINLFPSETHYYKSSTVWPTGGISAYITFTLNDGQLLSIYSDQNCNQTAAGFGSGGTQTNICAEFYMDINGKKPPNEFGKDTFSFFLTKKSNDSYQLLPFGIPADGYTCNSGSSSYLTGSHGCTYPMLMNQTMP